MTNSEQGKSTNKVEARPPSKGRASTDTNVPLGKPRATNTSTASYSEQVRRRRRASWRAPPLESGHADPWRYPPPVAGYECAARHLLDLGLTPAPNLPAMRAMHRCGSESRRVAEVIAERWELSRDGSD